MSEPIKLTDAEAKAAANLLYRQLPIIGPEQAISATVAAINKVRAGDPVGTIRRSETGAVAVKVRELEVAWGLIFPGSSPGWAESSAVASWDAIYTPEVS